MNQQLSREEWAEIYRTLHLCLKALKRTNLRGEVCRSLRILNGGSPYLNKLTAFRDCPNCTDNNSGIDL